jgi:F-box and leucine-rich repeat protein 2/20
MMMSSFFSLLSADLQILFLSFWLDVRSLSTLDVAFSCHRLRHSWMTLLQCLKSPAVDDWGHSLSSLMWLSRRGIRASRVQMTIGTSRVRVCDILQVDTSDVVTISLRGSNITDQCVMDIINRCPKLRSINLSYCGKVTDAGVLALDAGCGQLQSIDLSFCSKLTDAGITALGARCGQLQSIDLCGCNMVTDAGISAKGAGCGQLHSVNLSECNKVSNAGVSALGAGCGQLQSIDLHGCNMVTDAGVSALGVGCGQLQSIDLSFCYNLMQV